MRRGAAGAHPYLPERPLGREQIGAVKHATLVWLSLSVLGRAVLGALQSVKDCWVVFLFFQNFWHHFSLFLYEEIRKEREGALSSFVSFFHLKKINRN